MYSKKDIENRIYFIICFSVTICKRDGGYMAKFVARKPEKEVISMRIPLEILQILDDKAAEIGISRNELINQMIQFALTNMEEPVEE